MRPRIDAEFTGVEIPSAWLDRRLDSHDVRTRDLLMAQVQAYQPIGDNDVVTQVRRATRLGLMTGQTSGDAVASRLGLNRRTPDRRLAEQDTGLQRLLDETRFEVARQLLGETNLSVQHVGTILGFAEASAFTHAFGRWAGTSPSQWRRQPAGGQDFTDVVTAQDRQRRTPTPAR